jgi:hypothetical protein
MPPIKKGEARHGNCACEHAGQSRGRHRRTILTAVGRIEVDRRYFICPLCQQGDFGSDRLLGIDGYLTTGARRMACLAGIRQSFAQAEQLLRELARWELDDETIRRLCHAEAAKARADRQARPTAAAFQATPGDAEVQIDAGKVNTSEGWRDVKAAVFARRKRGEPACAAQWDKRQLPAPGIRSVIAAIEDAATFGCRCRTEARRLDWNDSRDLSVLGDGAEWIWNLSRQHFPGAAEVLDIYHGVEHLAAGSRQVFGEGASETTLFTDKGRTSLLEDGYAGVVEWIGQIAACMPADGDGAALGSVLNYFAGHQQRLPYALRLRRGQAIGSGLIEGTIKQLLNRRLKQTGARWKVEHVGPFVELGALADGPEWQNYWR